MKKEITASVHKALDTAQETVQKVEKEVELYTQPVNETVFKRFPILFTLLVTFGASTTFLALERLISNVQYLNDHPLAMLSIGLVVLVLTGTLYKKLG